ncbi:MAG: LacI family DNA-binding transcriptional regulator [Chthoniobacterales bacterium]
MERPPTIRDVARIAGVGASTVSLALRNDNRLRPAMRAHVQKIAEELGYRPNATIASLMAQLRASKTAQFQSTLGFLNASEDSAILREIPTFREWTRGASGRAKELGYSMDFFWLHEPGLTPARLKQILNARGVRGLIVAAMQNNGVLPSAYSELWSEFSCVVIGMRPQNPPLHFATNDQFSTAYHAVEELRKIGYERIGLVINPEIDAWLEHRFSAGFFAGRNGASEGRLPIFGFHKRDAKAFSTWLRRYKPDAIVTLHAEVKGWLRAAHLDTPRDIGLIHLDRESGMTDWAGMNQNSYFIGVAATDMVVGQLHRNDHGIPDFPKAVLIQSQWVPGATVRSAENRKPRARRGFSKV